jgi:hypothetical protein
MQSLGVKVNGTNPIPTIVVLYIMIPFSNLSKHKKKIIFNWFHNHFLCSFITKMQKKSCTSHFLFLYCIILFPTVFTPMQADRFHLYASRSVRLIWAQPNLNKVSDFLGQGGPVRRTFTCIDKLIGKALCNGLDVPESTFPSTSGKKVDCLVHTPQRRYINCLPSNNTSRSNTSCIFPWTTKLDKILPH